MLKSKSQSMQAPLALQARTYYSFPTPSNLFEKQHSENRDQTTLFKKNKQNKQTKQKLRRSKNNTTVHETIKNGVSRKI